jgi:hypothetical protein
MIEEAPVIPPSVIKNGFCKLPEWLCYYLTPNSLIVIREIKRTLKGGKYPYSDITNKQLAYRCNMCEKSINAILDKLVTNKYLRKYAYFCIGNKKRRKVYFGKLSEKRKQKCKGKSFKEKLIYCFRNNKRVEWSRLQTDDWLPWIPIPHGIKDKYALKVFTILIGQQMRKMRELRISDSQIALMAILDPATVANAITLLIEESYIEVEMTNKRNRIIRIK